jgi:hypothetical protein
MRSFRLALAFCLFGASACSLVLDTDALQKGKTGGSGAGGSAGAGGTAGTGGTAGAGTGGTAGELDASRDAGPPCNTDLDCQPVDTVDGCTSYKCAADKTCAAPRPYAGLAVVSTPGEAETADQAEDIGYPSLLADGTDLMLGFWKRSGATSNIVIRKYDERPEISPSSAELNAISGNRFESLSSSPGMFIRGIPRRVRLLIAAKPMGAAATGMFQMDVDVSNLRASSMQPARADLAVAGYDTSPRGPAPRLLAGVGEPVGMWIQQGKLFYFDASSAGEVFTSKRVIGFSPLFPTGMLTGGVHAALETTELGSTDDQGQTELWTRGSPSLTALINDQPGARRRGVATAATGEIGPSINFVMWSFERGGTPALFYAGASCDATQCIGFGAPTGTGDAILPAVAPAAASARVGSTMTDRDLAVTFQITVPDASSPGMSNTAILAGVSRLSTTVDGGPALSPTAMNPPSFVVTLGHVPPAILGPSSVAITSGGLMMVAWVERGPTQAVLKTKRFVVKTCP